MIWLALAALTVLAGTAVLSALSRALVAVSPSQLERELKERGQFDRDHWVVERLDRVEWCISFLRTFGRIAFLALVLIMVAGLEEPLTLSALLIACGVSAVMVWLFTGVVAGGFARYAPSEVIARTAILLRVAYASLYPVVLLASGTEQIVRRVVSSVSAKERQEEELLSSIEDTQRQGAIDRVSATILENVVEFGGTTVGAVMTPRSGIKGIPLTDDLGQVRSAIEEARFSRYPVYEDTLDNIVGVLYTKDLVPFLGRESKSFAIGPILRPPMRVPESKPVRELLIEFQRTKVHIAVVVDEYGGVCGVVTIEDVIEELVGEITDEHERSGPDGASIKRISPDTVEVRGKVSVYELGEILHMELPQDEGFETVAGLLLARFGGIPKAGEHLKTDGIDFEVLRASPTTIDLVRARKLPEEPPSGE